MLCVFFFLALLYTLLKDIVHKNRISKILIYLYTFLHVNDSVRTDNLFSWQVQPLEFLADES